MANRYKEIQVIRTLDGKRFQKDVKYPEVDLDINDTYVITVSGDRFDQLAYEYYRDASKWWIIAAANPEVSTFTLNIKPGMQIRIPVDPEGYIRKFEEFNQ